MESDAGACKLNQFRLHYSAVAKENFVNERRVQAFCKPTALMSLLIAGNFSKEKFSLVSLLVYLAVLCINFIFSMPLEGLIFDKGIK